MPRTFHYEIFTDYHQFYLQDDDQSFGDLSEAWTKEATGKVRRGGYIIVWWQGDHSPQHAHVFDKNCRLPA